MNKHIIISGISRSGKSTACAKLVKTLGYQHISMDSILSSLKENLEEPKKDELDLFPFDYSKTVAQIINTIIQHNDYDKFGYGMLIDVDNLSPEDYVRYIDRDYADIYFFGTPDLTPQQRFSTIRKYDTEYDYTSKASDRELLEKCKKIVAQSKEIQKQCKKFDLPFINTSFNREFIINEFVKKVIETH